MMEHKTMKKEKQYVPPKNRIVALEEDRVICGSPLPGGNEDIGYDDWN